MATILPSHSHRKLPAIDQSWRHYGMEVKFGSRLKSIPYKESLYEVYFVTRLGERYSKIVCFNISLVLTK